MIQFEILRQDSGKKLHRYVRQTLPGLPLSGIYKMIRVGRIKINGKKGKNDTVLMAGDQLTIYIAEEEYSQLAKTKPKFQGVPGDLDIVYEDEQLLVVNKPVGLLTHPDETEHKDTLINRALAYLYRQGEISDGRSFLPATVNRLDRNTSGIVLIGKDSETIRELAKNVREHLVHKQYLAIVWGKLFGEGDIDDPLTRDHMQNITLIDRMEKESAKSALTHYRALGTAAGFTLVQIDLISGRTHQIRAHMKALGHPLLGDVKYGGKTAFEVEHHLLHAHLVELPDGSRFVAPPSPVFTSVLQSTGLRRYMPS